LRRAIDAERLVLLPPGVDHVTAAAVLLKGLTAQYLVSDSFRVQPGDMVLVHAAAGGVGLLIGQWLATIGAIAIGTARGSEKVTLAQAHGYRYVIDYGTEDVSARVRELTNGKLCAAVYDSVGRDTWRVSLQCLRTRGTFVNFGQSSGPIEGFSISSLATGSFTATRPKVYDFIATPAELEARAAVLFSMVASGQLRVDTVRQRPLGDIVGVHRDLEARRTVGSVVLIP
jgi:NADPH2:quinone reductase